MPFLPSMIASNISLQMHIPRTKTPTRKKNHSRQCAFIGEFFSLAIGYPAGTESSDKEVLLLDLYQILSASKTSLRWPDYKTVANSKQFTRTVPAKRTGLDIITPDELDNLAYQIEPNFIKLAPILRLVMQEQRSFTVAEWETMATFVSLHVARSPLIAGQSLAGIKPSMSKLSEDIGNVFEAISHLKTLEEKHDHLSKVISIIQSHPNLRVILPHVSAFLSGATDAKQLAYKIEDETWSNAIREQFHATIELFTSYPIYAIIDRSGFPIQNVSHPNHFLCGKHLSISTSDRESLASHFRLFVENVAETNPRGITIFKDATHKAAVMECFLSSELPKTIWSHFIAGPVSRDLFMVFLDQKYEILTVPFLTYLSQGSFDLLSALHCPGQIICPNKETRERLYSLFSGTDMRPFLASLQPQ